MLKKHNYLVIGFIALFCIGSSLGFWIITKSNESDEQTNSSPMWEDYVENGIFTAQEEIHNENITYSLSTYMWRDFMPISPPDGKPLIAVITVYAHNAENFPLTTKIERLWIINGAEIKSASATDEFKVDGNKYEMGFRDGPKWDPGIVIDVVVKMKVNSQIYYLKAENQMIHATS
jgi:hypothetical protein